MKARELLRETKLVEGGNAFPNVGTIYIDELPATLKLISKITGIPNAEGHVLGSVGKVEYSGDIDVAVNLDRDQMQKLSDKLRKKLGNQNVTGIAGNVSMCVPIQGYDESKQGRQPRTGYVQVDLIAGDPEWMRTYYYSAGSESKYKGVIRNQALAVIAAFLDLKASKAKDEYGRPVKSVRWVWSPKNGLQKIIRTSRKNAHIPGRWVKAQNTEVLTEPLYDPNEIVKILFKGKVNDPAALNSAESAMKAAKKAYPPATFEKIRDAFIESVKDRVDVDPEDLTEATALNEATVHLEHLEDLLFNDGYNGAKEAVRFANGVYNMLAKGKGYRGAVTVKWDGSPAVFAGVDPADGKFFVGTKAVLSKNPKLIKSAADAKRYYGDIPDLANKLLVAFKYLRGMGIENMIQGDLMFSKDSLKHEDIDGEDYVTFTPNTITYAVPTNSKLGKKIASCDFGVVFHTAYGAADTVREMPMSYGVDISQLKIPNNVWVDDATYKDYTGVASLTNEEDAEIQGLLARVKADLAATTPRELNKLLADPLFKNYAKAFVNHRVRSGKHGGNPIQFVKEFLVFFTAKTREGMDKVSPAFQQKREDKVKTGAQFVKDNKAAIYHLLTLYNNINELKLALVSKLNVLDSVKTFVKTDGGYEVTNPEGFVAVGHKGNAVKLVNRLEFSQKNFNKVK